MQQLFPILTLALLSSLYSGAQQLTGPELLNKSISYHDPNNNWGLFKAAIHLEQSRPDRSLRKSVVELKNNESYFKLVDNVDGHVVVKMIDQNSSKITFNGSTDFSDENKEKYRLSKDLLDRTRNYYVYLYGLPMKLTDPGTNVAKEVERVKFDGKEYYELKVTYDENVGSDDWYFYMNPTTYAMEGYKFYHQNGKGEYILLEGTITHDGIKIPKLRKWYTTGDSTFLGADNIKSIEFID